MKGGWAGMTRAGENNNAGSKMENDLLPLNMLLHCRTVVEGKTTLTTGLMTNVEGELFEVEIHEFEQFELGETVKLTIYSPMGIQTMYSVVFAKYEGAIALLQPPELNKRFTGQDVPYLYTKSRLKAKVEIGIDFSCELEIVRRERHEDVLYCGAKMQVLEPEMLRPLRALILRQQVEKHAEIRRESNQKLSLND
jgi:hypothetical protein